MQALITGLQALFFLQNWNSFSPLISVFLLIIYEIRFFIFVVIIAIFGFSNAFFLIGQNQIYFTHIEIGNEPSYASQRGSFQYLFELTAFAGTEVDNFTPSADGSDSQQPVLVILLLMASFLLCLHLLNMLIGMMGDIQSRSLENKSKLRLSFKLSVVINYWWLNPLQNQKERYLVVATQAKNQ